MESCDFALAEKFANRAVERFSENEAILEASAQCYTEVGHIQKARACYQKAIAINPLNGWRKYLSYAQLLEGQEALLQYMRGIEVMETRIAAKLAPKKDSAMSDPEAHSESGCSTEKLENSPEDPDEPTPRDLSTAYLAVSELYTTDLW